MGITFDNEDDNPFNEDADLGALDQVIAFTKRVVDGAAILQHD